MIYTVTFNPALDYTIELDTINFGQVNRTSAEHITAGGKGINVSTVLNNLGVANTAMGFIGGFTGMKIEQDVRNMGINTDFVHLKKGHSRINVKLLSSNAADSNVYDDSPKETTDINAKGPDITQDDLDEFYKKLGRLQKGDTLVLSGAVPPSLPDYTYAVIMEKINERGIRTIVDAAGSLLVKSLSGHPFLVKPNLEELEDIYGTKCHSIDEVVRFAHELRASGAMNVLVSLGSVGAILICEDGSMYECAAPTGLTQSTVGAGDSMVAGFIYGCLKDSKNDGFSPLSIVSPSSVLAYAVAAGSATVFSRDLAAGDDITALAEQLHPDELL